MPAIQNNWRNRSSPRSKVKALGCLQSAITKSDVLFVAVECNGHHNFSMPSVISRAFSAPCVYSKFKHHPHPLGYLCAKFCFFRDLCCWASPWRKIVYSITHPAYLHVLNQSINQSITQLISCRGNWTEAFASEHPLNNRGNWRNSSTVVKYHWQLTICCAASCCNFRR